MSNLPEWPGANSVYEKLGKAAGWLAAQEHKAWAAVRANRTGRQKRMGGGQGFRVSQDVQWICDAMGRGNEEECKGLLGLVLVRDALKAMEGGRHE